MKTIKIYCELYRETFIFCPSMTPVAFEKLTNCEPIGDADGSTVKTKEGIYIWVRSDTLEALEDLVHECIHAANYLFERRGIETTIKNDEAQAYLVQWVFKKCLKHMRVK